MVQQPCTAGTPGIPACKAAQSKKRHCMLGYQSLPPRLLHSSRRGPEWIAFWSPRGTGEPGTLGYVDAKEPVKQRGQVSSHPIPRSEQQHVSRQHRTSMGAASRRPCRKQALGSCAGRCGGDPDPSGQRGWADLSSHAAGGGAGRGRFGWSTTQQQESFAAPGGSCSCQEDPGAGEDALPLAPTLPKKPKCSGAKQNRSCPGPGKTEPAATEEQTKLLLDVAGSSSVELLSVCRSRPRLVFVCV